MLDTPGVVPQHALREILTQHEMGNIAGYLRNSQTIAPCQRRNATESEAHGRGTASILIA